MTGISDSSVNPGSARVRRGVRSVSVVLSVTCAFLLSACGSDDGITPARVNRLDLDNRYVTLQDIKDGPNGTGDLTLDGDFTVDGGYLAVTRANQDNFPVLTTIMPPNWAVVDVNGPPEGAVGAIGTPAGVPDGEVVPTVLFSIRDMGEGVTLDEAQSQGITPFREDSSEVWRTDKTGDGAHRSTAYSGSRPGTVMDMKAVTEYMEWNGHVIGFAVVFTRDRTSVQPDWEASQKLVSTSIRLWDGDRYSGR